MLLTILLTIYIAGFITYFAFPLPGENRLLAALLWPVDYMRSFWHWWFR